LDGSPEEPPSHVSGLEIVAGTTIGVIYKKTVHAVRAVVEIDLEDDVESQTVDVEHFVTHRSRAPAKVQLAKHRLHSVVKEEDEEEEEEMEEDWVV